MTINYYTYDTYNSQVVTIDMNTTLIESCYIIELFVMCQK